MERCTEASHEVSATKNFGLDLDSKGRAWKLSEQQWCGHICASLEILGH